MRFAFASATLTLLLITGATLGQDPNSPPAITQQPQSQTVCVGADVTFTVVAEGSNLSYQWRKDDVPISGANSATLTLTAVTTLDTGNYDVIVANDFGWVASDAAALIVDAGPQIVTQPVGGEVCAGADYTLSVTLSNTGTSSTDTVGGTSSGGSGARIRGNYYRVDNDTTLTRIEQYLDLSAPGTIEFFVYEADAYGGPYTLIAQDSITTSTSGPAYYSSNALAVPLVAGRYYIIGAAWADAHSYYWSYVHPQATSFGSSLAGFALNYTSPLPDPPPANTNEAAYCQRITTSDLAMTYQWRKDDAPIPGAASSSYTIHGMSAADVGNYDVVIANSCGTVYSDVVAVTLAEGVTITQQPSGWDACAGDDVLLFVVASGPGLSYQWRKDGVDLPGETGPSLAINGATSNDAGTYDVIVSNACETLTSDPAVVTVSGGPPTVTSDPNDAQLCAGEALSLSVAADGENLGFQWRKDGVDLPGETGATLTIDPVATDDAGTYTVLVSNACGSVESAGALVTVDAPAAITQEPAGAVVCVGQPLTLAVTADGTSLAYQWRLDGQDIPGATAATYDLAAVDPNDAGIYDVVISNLCGQVVSDPAVVDVLSGPVIAQQPAGGRYRAGASVTLSVVLDPSSYETFEDTVGSPTYSSTGPRLRGNSYAVDTTVVLTRIEQYLDVATAGPLTFFVYEATDDEQGPYALVAQDTVTATANGPGFYASGELHVTLTAGRWYIIGAAWPDDHTYFWGGAHPQSVSFGQTVHGLATVYTSELPADPVPSSPLVWHQRLTTRDEQVSYQWRKNGTDLPGADAADLMLGPLAPDDSGNYDVQITNSCGTTTSDTAALEVLAPTAPAAQQSGGQSGNQSAQPR